MLKKFMVVFVVLMMAGPVWGEEVIKFVYSESFPPYSWKEDGQIKGILVDIANEALGKRMGFALSHEAHPWERAQHLVKTERADAMITNGPMREEWAEHSKETALIHEMKLYVKTDGPKLEELKKVKTLEELRPFSLVDHRGSGWAKKNLVDKNFNVHMVADQETMYKLLVKGRGDANINTSYVARYIIKSIGLQDQITELDVVFEAVPFHLVIGQKSPYTKVIPKFDETIKQMKEDGSLEKIFDKYR